MFNKHRAQSTVGALTALALFFGTAGATSATEISHSSTWSRDISKDIEAAIYTQPEVYQNTLLINEGEIRIDDVVVTAPTITGEELSLTLPTESLNDFQTPSSNTEEDYSVVVRDEGDGAFRSLIHIPNADSPKEYSFSVNPDYRLTHLEDGGIAVWDQKNNLLGTFTSPWAVDAHGTSINTDYIIDGHRLIQHVHTDARTVFPVVADPFWISALAIMGHFTRHALTQAAARGVSQALIKQVVTNGMKTAGKKGTSVFTQGKGKNRIRVIVDNKSGNIITVTKG
ncbi:DUF4258 domain-containing protein [Arcanobacterium haemolyticum]|nr:DUF4258 domain-containing protein [Arcanobacterium haemolyticum]